MNSIISTLNAQRPALDVNDNSDAKTAAKQVETVFLNELLRIMMEQTSFGQDKTVSTYLPAITSELSKSLAERGGIGVGEFLLKGNGLTRYNIKHKTSGAGTRNDSGQAGMPEKGSASVQRKGSINPTQPPLNLRGGVEGLRF